MLDPHALAQLRALEIPGVVSLEPGHGGLPKARVTNRWSQAEVYLHGAQVTAFQKRDEPPVLFLSERSRFAPGKAIRGGVPICFPWFGPRDGDVAHGVARITDWTLVDAASRPDGGAMLRFQLPATAVPTAWAGLRTEFTVEIADALTMELAVTNDSRERREFEACLHTYFAVDNVSEVTITGLESAPFIDHLNDDQCHRATGEPIRISSQTDRTYPDSTGPVEIHDPRLRRVIRIEKSGSASTVVWNPWTTQPLSDLGSEEYLKMVCVESGNIGTNRVELAPGAVAKLRVTVRSRGSGKEVAATPNRA